MSKSDTKLQILDTAIDLFWASSFHATNMNHLSQQAGVNKATVYQHFRSKEELAVAAVERACERTVTYIFQPAFADFDQPLARLRQVYRLIYDGHKTVYEQSGTSRGCPFVNIGMELANSNGPVREAVKSAFETFVTYYVQIVGALKEQGVLVHDLPTEQLARDLQDNMNACLITAKIEVRPEAILEGGARAVRHLVG